MAKITRVSLCLVVLALTGLTIGHASMFVQGSGYPPACPPGGCPPSMAAPMAMGPQFMGPAPMGPPLPKRISKCKPALVCGPPACCPPPCGPVMCRPVCKPPVRWY